MGVRWSRRGNAVDGGIDTQRRLTFHDRGGPYGRTKGAKRVVAVDVTRLPVGALVAPASTHENRTTELMLQHLTEQVVSGRLELVLVDRGVTAAAARELGRDYDLELRRVGWDDNSRTTTAATGWLQVACIATTLRHLPRPRTHRPARAPAA